MDQSVLNDVTLELTPKVGRFVLCSYDLALWSLEYLLYLKLLRITRLYLKGTGYNPMNSTQISRFYRR